MATTHPTSDPAGAPPMTQEADIGSGEKSPGQLDTEKVIQSVPELPDDGETGGANGRGTTASPASGSQPQ